MFRYILAFLFAVHCVAQQITQQEQYAKLATMLFERVSPAKDSTERFARVQRSPLSPEVSDQHVAALRDLVSANVIAALRQSAGSPSEELARSIRDMQGQLHEWSKELPYSAGGAVNGQPVATVAFEVLRGPAAVPEPEPFLQFYLRSAGTWYLAAEAPRDLSRLAIRVQQLKSPVENEIWVLAWGRRYGDTGARTTARLYAFDGASVKTLWGRDELLTGRITVSGDRMTVSHYDPARRRIDPPDSEEYLLTARGIMRVR